MLPCQYGVPEMVIWQDFGGSISWQVSSIGCLLRESSLNVAVGGFTLQKGGKCEPMELLKALENVTPAGIYIPERSREPSSCIRGPHEFFARAKAG